MKNILIEENGILFLLENVGENSIGEKYYTKTSITISHKTVSDGKLYVRENSKIVKEYEGEYDHLKPKPGFNYIHVKRSDKPDAPFVGYSGEKYVFQNELCTY